jgi:hypothetical protein
MQLTSEASPERTDNLWSEAPRFAVEAPLDIGPFRNVKDSDSDGIFAIDLSIVSAVHLCRASSSTATGSREGIFCIPENDCTFSLGSQCAHLPRELQCDPHARLRVAAVSKHPGGTLDELLMDANARTIDRLQRIHFELAQLHAELKATSHNDGTEPNGHMGGNSVKHPVPNPIRLEYTCLLQESLSKAFLTRLRRRE